MASQLLAITDALITELAAIDRVANPAYGSAKVKAGYGPVMRDAGLSPDLPVVYVEPGFWRDEPQSSARQHEAEYDIRITGIVQSAKPVVAIAMLFDDIRKCVQQVMTKSSGDRLGGRVMTIWPVEAEMGVETFQQSGRGSVVLTVRARYRVN